MPYIYEWRRGMPMPGTRAAETRQLGDEDEDARYDMSDWPPITGYGAPERAMYDQVQPGPLGLFDQLSRNEKTLLYVAVVGAGAWFLLRRKRKRNPNHRRRRR